MRTLSRSKGAGRLYHYMVDQARMRDRVYFCADTTAAEALGVSRRTIIRWRCQLESEGWIVRCGWHNWGQRSANSYPVRTIVYRFPRRRVTQRSTSRRAYGLSLGMKPLCRRYVRVRGGERMPESVQTILGEWVDWCRERGIEPPKRIVGQTARELKILSVEGATWDELRRCLKRLVEGNVHHPSQLAALLFDLRLSQRDQLQEFLGANGGRWPTGSRIVRGTHATTCVHDPLGYDPPERGASWGRPTKEEVIAALRERSKDARSDPSPD